MFEGENFRGFRGFSLNHECFAMNYGLVDGNVSLQACYHESFPTNGNFVP